MTRDDALARIQEGLGFRTDLDDTIIARMQEAQRILEKGMSLPWFLITEGASLAGTANDGTLALPADFLRFVEDETPSIVTEEGATRFLKRRAYDWLVDYVQDDEGEVESGDPLYFALRKSTLEVAPVPDEAYTVTLTYYAFAADLTAASESVWLDNVPDLIIGRAGESVARDIQNEEAQATFRALADVALAGLIREIAEREQSGRELQMGAQA